MSSDFIFVYGTLKRGFSRAGAWPHEPLSVSRVYAPGELFDLKSFPGFLTRFDTWVEGEVWEIAEEGMPDTLEVLDDIEGFVEGGKDNLYERLRCEIYSEPTFSSVMLCEAWIYEINRKQLKSRSRILPSGTPPFASWTKK